MSRLTSTLPFNKPSPFDLIHQTPTSSIPEPQYSSQFTNDPQDYPIPQNFTAVDIEAQQQSMDFPRHSLDSQYPAEHQHTVQDPYHSRVRRLSNLHYNSSHVRDSFVPQTRRRTKWLLVVVPSPGFDREPQILGNGNSNCPPGRFAGGILLPLLSTVSLYCNPLHVSSSFYSLRCTLN